jgi:molybdopterin converting factor subunit 1
MSDPSVRVLFFAAAREIARASELPFPIAADGTTVGALATAIVARFPAFEGHLRSLRFAVNGEYKKNDDRVAPGDEVAVLPPVAGG